MADKKAAENLFNYRSSCNKILSEHPTVVIQELPNEVYEIGVVGILNGIFGTTIERIGFDADNVRFMIVVWSQKDRCFVEHPL